MNFIAAAARVWGRLTSDETPILCPPWRGEPPPANLIVTQQRDSGGGAGDAMCMARYFPLLHRKGYRVVFKSAQPLERLLQYSFKDESDVPIQYCGVLSVAARGAAGHFQPTAPTYRVPMMMLPQLFNGGTPHNPRSRAGKRKPVYAPKAYLRADPARVEYYKARVPEGAIGLCWASGRFWPGEIAVKSMALADMEPIWSRFPCVSLQLGQYRAEIAGTPVLDVFTPTASDWLETAALIGSLRCVVTVDTGVAHLAGALGADVRLAMHMRETGYWMVRGVDSPWYPRTRVYQGRHWAPVVARIAAAL